MFNAICHTLYNVAVTGFQFNEMIANQTVVLGCIVTVTQKNRQIDEELIENMFSLVAQLVKSQNLSKDAVDQLY